MSQLDLESAIGHLEFRWLMEPQVADIVFHSDYVWFARTTLKLDFDSVMAQQRSDAHGFPLPKERGGFRTLCHLDPADQLLFQAVAEVYARRTDHSLGPDVYSHRLAPHNPDRLLRPALLSFGLFRNNMVRAYSSGLRVLGSLDVKNFYNALSYSRLKPFLVATGIDHRSLLLIKGIFQRSQKVVVGLPQDHEASDVLANGFLRPMDMHASRVFQGFYGRYSDDAKLLGSDEGEVRDALAELIEIIEGLGLEVNLDKRQVVSDTEALRAIHDEWKNVIKYGESVGHAWVEAEIREFFEERIVGVAKPEWADSRFALNAMARRVDAYALGYLLRNLRQFVGVPGEVGRYLREFGVPRSRTDDFFEVLGSPPTVSIEHLRHHLLRASWGLDAGNDERQALMALVARDGVPSANKAWIARVLGKWGGVRVLKFLRELGGDLVDSLDGQLLRGVLVGLAENEANDEVLTNRVRIRRPELVCTVAYLDEAKPLPPPYT